MVAAGPTRAVVFSLSPGQAGDAPEGRKLLRTLDNGGWEGAKVIMDKAYEGDETRQLVFELGMGTPLPGYSRWRRAPAENGRDDSDSYRVETPSAAARSAARLPPISYLQ